MLFCLSHWKFSWIQNILSPNNLFTSHNFSTFTNQSQTYKFVLHVSPEKYVNTEKNFHSFFLSFTSQLSTNSQHYNFHKKIYLQTAPHLIICVLWCSIYNTSKVYIALLFQTSKLCMYTKHKIIPLYLRPLLFRRLPTHSAPRHTHKMWRQEFFAVISSHLIFHILNSNTSIKSSFLFFMASYCINEMQTYQPSSYIMKTINYHNHYPFIFLFSYFRLMTFNSRIRSEGRKSKR